MTVPTHTDPTDLRVPQALADLRRALQRRGLADGGFGHLLDALGRAISVDREEHAREMVRRARLLRDELEQAG